MTARDLYSSVWGPPNMQAESRRRNVPTMFNSLFETPGWQNDPATNPALREATDDDRMLVYQKAAFDLADKLYKKNKANQLQNQTQLLQSLVQQPNVNLFTPPENDTEAEAQRSVQEYLNAGKRGFAAGLAQQEKNRKRAIENLGIKLKLRDQALQEAMFPINEMSARARLANSLRVGQPDPYKEQALRQRTAAQTSLDENRRKTEQRAQFEQARRLIERSGANPSEIISSFPALTREHFAALDAMAKAYNDRNLKEYNDIKRAAEDYTEQLAAAEEAAGNAYTESHKPGWFGRLFGRTVDESGVEESKDRARQQFLKQRAKELGKAGIRFDETSGGMVPVESAPERYTPLDRAMAARGGGGQMSGALPVVRTPADLQRYSQFKVVITPDGRRKLNPYYREEVDPIDELFF